MGPALTDTQAASFVTNGGVEKLATIYVRHGKLALEVLGIVLAGLMASPVGSIESLFWNIRDFQLSSLDMFRA